MAKILCAYSGIEFKCEHFSITLNQHEFFHPIFAVPKKRLFPYYNKWLAGELTETDSFLLFAALLHSTDLVEFRRSLRQRPDTAKIIASNMESLFSIAWRINEISHPSLQKLLPRVAITFETSDLSNVKYWLATWQQAFDDFAIGLKNEELRSKIQKRESALEKLIKNPAINPIKYAHILAQWACDAASFPDHTADYWKEVIIKSHTDTDLISIPLVDIDELLEHCEENIELGTIYSYHLFNTLREAKDTIQGFFGISNSGASFTMLSNDDSVQTANLNILIETAPASEPKRMDYPTEFAFIKARMKWNLAQAQGETK